MSGKSKTLPCIAINYEEDDKNGVCPNPALNGPTVNGKKRICYCQYHWEKLLNKNAVNVNFDVVKNFVKNKKVSEKKKKNLKDEYKTIKAAIKKAGYEVCFEDNKRVLPTASECSYKIICPDKNCKDPDYLSHGARSPRSPRSPAADRAAALKPGSPGLHGNQISGPLTPTGVINKITPRIRQVEGASSAGSSKSSPKSSKKSKKDESDSDNELGSDNELDSEEEMSGSDYSESGSDEEASESDEDEVKTKLRVPGYGGNDKKITNYKTIVKSKGVKPNKRNIRGRYEIVRSDIAPRIRITKDMVKALEILDNTYDLQEALDKISYIIGTLKNNVKNINIAEMKKKDQSMWSVEESVVNYVAEKFAPYINDSDRIELLMSYIFDYDRRDLTKKFSFYGFTTPKDMLDQTPYQRLVLKLENKNVKETIVPEIYPPAYEKKATAIHTTSVKKIDIESPPKDNKSPSGTCSKTKLGTGNDLTAIITALQNESCLKISPIEGTGNKSKNIDAVKTSLNKAIGGIFNLTSNSGSLGKFKLDYKPNNKPEMDEFTSEAAKEFIKELYDSLDRFYNEAKAITDTGKNIDDKSVTEFVNNLSDNTKGVIGKLNDDLFKQVFDMTPKSSGGSTPATVSTGSAAKSGSTGKNNNDTAKFDSAVDSKIKNPGIKNILKQLPDNLKPTHFTDFLTDDTKNKINNADTDIKIKNVVDAINTFKNNNKSNLLGKDKEYSLNKFKKWITAGNYDTAWDGK